MNLRLPHAYIWLVVAAAALASAAWALMLPPDGPGREVAIFCLIIALVGLYLTFRAHRDDADVMRSQQTQIEDASHLRHEVIEALCLAIDARHRTTQSIRHEQHLAVELARAFGLNTAEIEGVRTAALLHDVGKLAVPDHILTKRGPLDTEEFQKVRIHPQVGAGIISGVAFPYPVASLVLCHHERWDGTGYPSGLRGAEIPLGARILACVDQYEALTSDRPFHRAITHAEALNVLWSEAGKALDPVVVARFAEVITRVLADGRAAGSPTEPAVQPDGDRGIVALRNITEANTEILNLYDMSRAIGATLGISNSMAVIAAKLQNLVPFDTSALFLREPAGNDLQCRYANGPSAERLRRLTVPVGAGVVGDVAARRTCLVNADPDLDLTASGHDDDPLPFKSMLACPLVVSDDVVGVLALYASEPSAFSEDQRRIVHAVSEQAAAVILNSVVFEQTQVDSVTDPLTGLPNIRLLFVHLNRELARASRLDSPMALLLLDLDDLKRINDRYGHAAGDAAICKVATALSGSIRPYDLCVRYGGDEFIVVLAECGGDLAESRLRDLRYAVDAIVFEVAGHQRVPLSASGGAAVFPDDGRTYEALLATADRRMYQDKAGHKKRSGAPATADPTGSTEPAGGAS